ncbi:MAG: 23S rRNA (guanosine(2251)-2'-O)-methyltransferase RlmB [Cyclobacteriaceae bacterium]|nr:23S rRNA (guanosine(2251)-2'-O)-methyltransferase RlmB [Cyclobacteriaceae bacterium]MCH8516302.1 23S rRNA (guanosine(2251)-2'-O)-methyltransferase RlmB [Cyclobacteriaceae bacterium]
MEFSKPTKDYIFGTRSAIEAIHAGKDIDKILIQKGIDNELIKELKQLAADHSIPMQAVPIEKLRRYHSKNHQGVISFLSSVSFSSLDNVISSCYADARDPFLLVLDRITDVRNFGAIVRSADCMGVSGIIIPEKEQARLSADAVKTSAGALHHMPICREKSLKSTLRELQNNGLKVVAITEKAESNVADLDLSGPIALIMGSEENGISPELLKQADFLAKIPMQGKVASLNVSAAASIALYETAKARS